MWNLAKSDPLKPLKCEREDCFSCTSGGGGDCSKNCSAYRLEYKECPKFNLKAVYEGETGRNGYSRGLEHLAGLRRKTIHCGSTAKSSIIDGKLNSK